MERQQLNVINITQQVYHTIDICVLYREVYTNSTPSFNNIPHHLQNHAIFNVRVKEHPLTVLIWLNRLGFDHITVKHFYMNANGIFVSLFLFFFSFVRSFIFYVHLFMVLDFFFFFYTYLFYIEELEESL